MNYEGVALLIRLAAGFCSDPDALPEGVQGCEVVINRPLP